MPGAPGHIDGTVRPCPEAGVLNCADDDALAASDDPMKISRIGVSRIEEQPHATGARTEPQAGGCRKASCGKGGNDPGGLDHPHVAPGCWFRGLKCQRFLAS